MNLKHLKHSMFAAVFTTVFVPALAFASVGKVAELQGKASRTAKDGGQAAALASGTEIEVGDTLKVEKGGALKIQLNDESVIAVGPESQLVINEAEFSGLERKGFSAKLFFGSVWAKVKKVAAGSEAKFEVTTERAVAGVRGTIFRVDATKLLKASIGSTKKKPVPVTIVRVNSGLVAVDAKVKSGTPDSGTAAAGGQTKNGAQANGQSGKPHTQIAAPQEISKDAWEKKFVELQKNMQVTVGEDMWDVAQLQLPKDDALKKFVAKDDAE